MNLRKTKYIWLPAALLVYALIMAYQGLDILTVQRDYLRFFGTLGAELAVIIALSWFLRRKFELARRREQADNMNSAASASDSESSAK